MQGLQHTPLVHHAPPHVFRVRRGAQTVPLSGGSLRFTVCVRPPHLPMSRVPEPCVPRLCLARLPPGSPLAQGRVHLSATPVYDKRELRSLKAAGGDPPAVLGVLVVGGRTAFGEGDVGMVQCPNLSGMPPLPVCPTPNRP